LSAASAGQLSSPDSLLAQYNRLMNTAQGHSRIQQFVMEWLGADNIAILGNSSSTLTPQIASYMKTETQNYIENAVFNSTGTLNELLTADYTYVNAPLASYYGINSADSTNNFYKVSASGSLKIGILSQGSFLASSAASGIAILHRGDLLRDKLYCQQLPSVASLGLPGFTPPALNPPGPGQTTRQELEQVVQKGTACYACHQYFMPIGFALDHFDPFGKFRITENGAALDTSGFVAISNYIDPASGLISDPLHATDENFSDYNSFTQVIANDPLVQSCFAKRAMVFVSGRNDVANNECAVSNVQAQFATSGSKVLSGFSAYIQSPSFIQRVR